MTFIKVVADAQIEGATRKKILILFGPLAVSNKD